MSGLAWQGWPEFASAAADLPTPDFTYDADRPPFVAGLRPYREGRFRLEMESFGDRTVVHNYGHGGAGITMSWGCAHEVRDLVAERIGAGEPPRVAVLGAGVMGLTAATLLTEMGLDVTVYAKGLLEETTSHVAGGQFAPSTVAYDTTAAGTAEFERILRRSFRSHEARLTQGFGVVRRDNYAGGRSRSLDVIPRDVVPEPEALTRLPFAGHDQPGYLYKTLLIEPHILLRKLEVDLRIQGVWMVRREFLDADDVLTLDEPLIVNCLGLGAGQVFADPAVVPIKGQLVILPPQAELDYLYTVGSTYIFPRRDGVVVGGTFERDFDSVSPDPAMCREVLEWAKGNFTGELEGLLPPPWMVDDTES